MFSSSSSATSFKGLIRKAANEGGSLTSHIARPSTATPAEYYHNQDVLDLLEPALDGPPSPEGIRAFRRRMKRVSIAENLPNEPATSSGASSLRSESREPSWERGPENISLSRNPSQRSSIMATKERPDSVQLFSKTVFGRRPRLRRGQTGPSTPGSSLVSVNEIPAQDTAELPKENIIQSMFARRRTKTTSETSPKKIQISGPYDFQHVLHSSKDSVTALDDDAHFEAPPSFSNTRPRTAVDASNSTTRFNLQDLDKPLPTTPTSLDDQESISPRDSIQFSPPRLPRPTQNEGQTSPIAPPRTSSRVSALHERGGSISKAAMEHLRTNSTHQVQPFILPSTEGLWPTLASHANNDSELDSECDDRVSPYPMSTIDDNAWPLTSSMTSLSEVPEEEEYRLSRITSRTSIVSNAMSLKGSISVPHLRRMSLNQVAQRPPSNASDTLGMFQHLAAQRSLHRYDDGEMDEDDFLHDSWEEDIDYCYEHAAEADCEFPWERLSVDLDYEDNAMGRAMSHRTNLSFGSFGPASGALLAIDAPELSPTSYGSATTLYGAITPSASSNTPMTSNFSLPRLDTASQLKYDHNRADSRASSLQEGQGFCLSPSLLIPNNYHDSVLEYEGVELRPHASSEELRASEHDGNHLKLSKSGEFLHARSSASTTISTLSDRSFASSRYPSSTFTRWTGSSSSSWQAHDEPQQPVAITVSDKESIVTPISDATVVSPVDSVGPLPRQASTREGHHSRAQSEANLLTKTPHDTITPLEPRVATEVLKTHRRARTSSRSHANSPPQFALFPQVQRS